jgi:protein-tyrosine phosphatase
MARQAAFDGIYTLVATPYIDMVSLADNDAIALKNKIYDQLVELRYHCTIMGIPLNLIAGGTVSARMDPACSRSFALNGGNYVLIEFPNSHLPADAAETIFNFVEDGLIPIVAHPERNNSVMKCPDGLFNLVRSGALVQITGGSLLGDFGCDVKTCAIYLLKTGVVSFLTSDAHSSFKRGPMLSDAVRAVTRYLGERIAYNLVVTNPSTVLAGNPLF